MRTLEAVRKGADGDAAMRAVALAVKARRAPGEKIMGFGYRVYQVRIPRATRLRRISTELADSCGESRCNASRRMEEVVFAEKGLYSNVDFYAASAYRYLGVPAGVCTPGLRERRMAGLTPSVPQHADNRLIRPASEDVGERPLNWVPLAAR
jgi:citrate synthase